MELTIASYFAIIIMIALVSVGVIAWIRERKELSNYKSLTKMRVYHCIKCNAVYTALPLEKTIECPICKNHNSNLRF